MLNGEIQGGPVSAGLTTRDDIRNLIHQDNVDTKDGVGVEAEFLSQITTRLEAIPV
jgi:hypothetical protein